MACAVFMTSTRCMFIIDFLIGAAVQLWRKAHRCPFGPFVLDSDEVVPSGTCQDDLCGRRGERFSLQTHFYIETSKLRDWFGFWWRSRASNLYPQTLFKLLFIHFSPQTARKTSAVIIDDFWGRIKSFIDLLSLPVCSSNSLNYYRIWRLMHKHDRVQKPERKNKSCLYFIIYLNQGQVR